MSLVRVIGEAEYKIEWELEVLYVEDLGMDELVHVMSILECGGDK